MWTAGIRTWRKDVPLENALLFLRGVLVFRDYEDTVRCDDNGEE